MPPGWFLVKGGCLLSTEALIMALIWSVWPPADSKHIFGGPALPYNKGLRGGEVLASRGEEVRMECRPIGTFVYTPDLIQFYRIVQARETEPIKTTKQLAQVVGATQWSSGKAGKTGSKGIHPATRTFQALRIAVNDELGKLEQVTHLSGLRTRWE